MKKILKSYRKMIVIVVMILCGGLLISCERISDDRDLLTKLKETSQETQVNETMQLVEANETPQATQTNEISDKLVFYSQFEVEEFYGNHFFSSNTELVQGKKGEGVLTAGQSDSFLSILGSKGFALTKNITVLAWFKPLSIQAQDYENPIVSQHGWGSGWELRTDEYGPIFTITVNDLHYSVQASERVWNGQWYHFGGTFDGQHIRSYLNGKLAQEAEQPGYIKNYDGNINIGRNGYWTDRNFHGVVDEVIIFERALSEAEINEIYNAKNDLYEKRYF